MASAQLAAPLLGFLLGATLIVAAMAKILAGDQFEETLQALVGDTRAALLTVIARVFPWVELSIGTAAWVMFDVAVVRGLTLALFATFLIVLATLSVRYERFNCGCFGSHRAERRAVLIGRGVLWLLVAFAFWRSPAAGPLTIMDRVWMYTAEANVLLVVVLIRQMWQLTRTTEGQT